MSYTCRKKAILKITIDHSKQTHKVNIHEHILKKKSKNFITLNIEHFNKYTNKYTYNKH